MFLLPAFKTEYASIRHCLRIILQITIFKKKLDKKVYMM